MIKLILFDIGNVLIKSDVPTMNSDLLKRCGIDQPSEKDLQKLSALVEPYSLGRINSQKFYERIKRQLGFDGSFKEFAEIWNSCMELENDRVIQLLVSLSDEYKVGLASDNSDLHTEFGFELAPILREVDYIFLSQQIGYRKTSSEFWMNVLMNVEEKPNEIVFIDDNAENTRKSEEFGIHGIIFEDLELLADELDQLDVTV